MTKQAKLDQLLARWDELREQGQEVAAEELCSDSPELADELKRSIQKLKAMDWLDDASGKKDGTTCNCGDGDLKIPPVLGGRYRMEGMIAEGGFGQVWRATDTALLRSVAVKITTLNCVDEARRVAKLKHPGIVSVHDVGSEGAFCFIVFDLIEGDSLAGRLRRGRLPWQESASIVATVAENLHYAHEKGFVHRDIKPANILLDEASRPLLADFGIAVTKGELQYELATSTGTLAYMSPEQLTANEKIDARTDVYSLGVVLYEMLTGRLPFQADALADLRQQILIGLPTSIRAANDGVPVELERICLRCLSMKPADRYPTAHDLAHALRELLAKETKP